MSNILKIGLKFFVLVLLGFLFELIFSGNSTHLIYNLLENLLFVLALICPLYILNNKFKKGYLIISYIIFVFCICFESVFYYIFKTSFSSSTIFIILESNVDESKEFIQFYADIPIAVFTMAILIVALSSKLNKLEIRNTNKAPLKKFKIAGLFVLILLFLKISALIVFNVPYLLLKSSVEYIVETNKLSTYKTNKIGDFQNVSRNISNEEKEVFVVVIGESTSRSHMGIYNYYRQTTPNLNKIKDELIVYNDVISPHAYSVGSLSKILTLGNYEHPDMISEGSIIQLFNSVGFETYWLSNQRPIGPFESMITKIAMSSTNQKFLTTTLARNSKVLDEELLDEFKLVLNNDVNKKVIFLHLMGTHHDYQNRYPEAFKQFESAPKTKFKSPESFLKINHYDNAILYNDFIISNIIHLTKAMNSKSFVLYFSDHGEEMYDDINFAGHNEDIYSKKMFEVPFFIWQSNKFKAEKQLFYIKGRQYMIDDLFHSFADLVDIQADEVDNKRSIFNKSFKERLRVIKDTINYDTYFD